MAEDCGDWKEVWIEWRYGTLFPGFSLCLLTDGVGEVTEMAGKLNRSMAKEKDAFSKQRSFIERKDEGAEGVEVG